jgi:hypothetical protein
MFAFKAQQMNFNVFYYQCNRYFSVTCHYSNSLRFLSLSHFFGAKNDSLGQFIVNFS